MEAGCGILLISHLRNSFSPWLGRLEVFQTSCRPNFMAL
jgi:hypothetical protein